MPMLTLRVVTTIGEGPWGWNRKCHRALPEDSPVHSPVHSPPQWGPGTWEDEEAEPPFLDFDLEPPPELGPDVSCFLQEPASNPREDSWSDSSPEPQMEDYKRWVMRQGQALNMPSWWQELVEIPEVGDFQELTQKIWYSFELPQRMSKLHDMENYYLAPLAPKCFHQKDSSHCQIQSSPAGISKRDSWRRPWPMHRLSIIGWRNPTCLHWANHAFWWGASSSWGKWWSHTSPSMTWSWTV